MADDVLIAGGGRVGASLARRLIDSGHRVRLVEIDPENVARLGRSLPADALVEGSASDPEVLERAGIHTVGTVAAVTQADEVNLVVASLARFEFSVPHVIGRVNNPKNAWLYTADMGVDIALDQAGLIAMLIAEEMSLGDMTILLKLRRGQYSVVEERVHPASAAVAGDVASLPLPERCVLVAVLRDEGIAAPRGSTRLAAGDEVIALVHRDEAAALAALLGDPGATPAG